MASIMRLKTEIWVKAYLRQLSGRLVPAVVARRGQRDAGAIFIKINRLDGTALVLAPAPSGLDGEAMDRCWAASLGGEAVAEEEADAYLRRQATFDADIWIVEVEDRQGRHFLGEAVIAL